MNNNEFYITDFGAVADGITDCTDKIQKAIDSAALVQGVVIVPSGEFLCGGLKLKPHVKIMGHNTRSYRANGGSVLKLNDKNAICMIDITDAYGCVINGLCLDGDNLGQNIHGIATVRKDDEHLKEEDTPVIDSCKISNFTGDGIRLQRIWCFSVRHCMIGFNGGNGLYIKGWDGFIIDNWFSYNKGCGVLSDKEMSAVIFNANRVEWNAVAGFKFINPIGITINGNAFDASGGPAIDLCNPKGCRASDVSITGNYFHRSGMPAIRNENSGESCHVYMKRCINTILTSNLFHFGIDDEGHREMLCPKIGIRLEKLSHCIIKDNTMRDCATEKVLSDDGAHEDGNVIECCGTTQKKIGEYIYSFFKD